MNNKLVILIILLLAVAGIYYIDGKGGSVSDFLSIEKLKERVNLTDLKEKASSSLTSFTKNRIAEELTKDKNATTSTSTTTSADTETTNDTTSTTGDATSVGDDAQALAHIQAISNNFTAIVTQRFEIAGKPQIARFWFVGDADTYVEYRDGKGFRRVLITFPTDAAAAGSGTRIYNAIGYFVPVENGWELTIGQDKVFNAKPFYLYEFDPDEGSWVRQN
ncbi:MAG: hypothetical protein UY09_C0016G0022 [Parcubacteria group bacterium GW2011_GWA2_47_8]|nr:MAG: hypothetical protein UY09_C0016G0022 [Parcubacteria group bacterium GW2011_GWA2_47_8]